MTAQENTPNDSEILVADAYLEFISASLDKGGKAQEILSALQQLPLTESSKVPYQIQLARAYVQVGRTKDAESILLQCSHDDPTSVDAVRLLGSYYVQTQKWNDAEKFWLTVSDKELLSSLLVEAVVMRSRFLALCHLYPTKHL